MPKNKGKGGKNRRRGKNENEYVAFTAPTINAVTFSRRHGH